MTIPDLMQVAPEKYKISEVEAFLSTCLPTIHTRNTKVSRRI